jgi:hypothetical protein
MADRADSGVIEFNQKDVDEIRQAWAERREQQPKPAKTAAEASKQFQEYMKTEPRTFPPSIYKELPEGF